MTQLQRAIEDSVAFRGLVGLEEPLNRAAQMVLRCLTSGTSCSFAGNGGQRIGRHTSGHGFLGRFVEDRRPYPAISLTANGEFMTAVCNDYWRRRNFARQVWGLGEKGRCPYCAHNQRQIKKRFARAGRSRTLWSGKHLFPGPRTVDHQRRGDA